VLRQALGERIKPVLIVNKVDRALLELQLPKEELYQNLSRIIESVNVIISTYNDAQMGDVQVYPEKGTVAFGSGLHGWAFTLRQFAKRYAKKFGVDQEKMIQRLWGDNYFNAKSKKWTTRGQDDEGKPLERAFCSFVLDPIYKLFEAITNGKKDVVFSMLEKLEITMKSEEKALEGKQLLKTVMKKFLPAGDALLEMVILHLPSPVTAQKYRVETLYTGPLDDVCAQAIRNCDPNGPLMMYVSKMVPSNDKGHFYAFGRVFSGRIKTGQRVRIMGPNYEPSSSGNSSQSNNCFVRAVQRTVVMMGRHVEAVTDCPCGNTIALVGIDECMIKGGTITDIDTAYPIQTMKFSVFPVLSVAVSPQKKEDLPKLVAGLKHLMTSDPCVVCRVSECGEHIVEATGELHLEISLKDLEEVYAQIPLRTSRPIVTYRETVMGESDRTCLAKSANKHNRLFVKAEPLNPALAVDIETSIINPTTADSKVLAHYLTDTYQWNGNDARRIWCFGPDNCGANVMVNQCGSVQYLHEVKDSVVTGFQWATKQGVLCDEPMRGVRFNLIDATLHADAIHRGAGQIIPTIRRAVYASQLTARPRVQEPVYMVVIQCPTTVCGSVYSAVNQRRGQIVSEERAAALPLSVIKAYLPVSESFGFGEYLRSQTSGQAFPQCSFDHWEVMEGDPLDSKSKVGSIVTEIRKRKGLTPCVPPLEQYFDKL